MSWSWAERFWQVNLVQVGFAGCVLGIVVTGLAMRPTGSVAGGGVSGGQTLQIPQAVVAPDFDKALGRLVEDSFTSGRHGAGSGVVDPEPRPALVRPSGQTAVVQQLTPPPRPLAVNTPSDGVPLAYYPGRKDSGDLLVRRRGERVGRWTITEISQSHIRYRNGSQEHEHTLFGEDADE